MPPKKNKTEPKKQPTLSGLAAVLGVSRQLIAAHRRKPDAPALSDVAGWEVFLARYGRTGSAPEDLRRAIAEERLNILKATRAKIERENDEAARRLIPIDDARRQNAEAWAFVFSELERWENEVPPLLAGLSAVEIFKHMFNRKEAFRRAAKERFEKASQ